MDRSQLEDGFSIAYPTVEYYDRVQTQDHADTRNNGLLRALRSPAQSRRSASPSPPDDLESTSSIETSDDNYVTALIDAVPLSSPTLSGGDPQGLKKTETPISNVMKLTLLDSEDQQLFPLTASSASDFSVARRVHSPVQGNHTDTAPPAPQTPEQPSNPTIPTFTFSRRPHREAGLNVIAPGSLLPTTRSPSYSDVPELIRKWAADGAKGQPTRSIRPSPAISNWTSPIRRPSSLSNSTPAIRHVTATSPEDSQAAGDLSSLLGHESFSGPSESCSKLPTIGNTTGTARVSPGTLSTADPWKSKDSRNTFRFNTSPYRQSLANSFNTLTSESKNLTYEAQTSKYSPQTPTRQPRIFKYPPPDPVRPFHRPERPFPGPMDPPLLPIRSMAVTRSQAITRARQIMGVNQNSPPITPTHYTPFGVGLSAAENARQAEAEKVRIQQYAARKTAENNPPPTPDRRIRQNAIATIRAATNKRLDEQAYAARMAREARARARVQQINRVRADVDGTAPQMAEATHEAIEAARILMQMQRAHIAGLEGMVQQVHNQAAAEHHAAIEADNAATRAMYARHAWDLQMEHERRERERARDEGNQRLEQAREWRRAS